MRASKALSIRTSVLVEVVAHSVGSCTVCSASSWSPGLKVGVPDSLDGVADLLADSCLISLDFSLSFTLLALGCCFFIGEENLLANGKVGRYFR